MHEGEGFQRKTSAGAHGGVAMCHERGDHYEKWQMEPDEDSAGAGLVADRAQAEQQPPLPFVNRVHLVEQKTHANEHEEEVTEIAHELGSVLSAVFSG